MKTLYAISFALLLTSCFWGADQAGQSGLQNAGQAENAPVSGASGSANSMPAPTAPGFCKWDLKQLSSGQQRICKERWVKE